MRSSINCIIHTPSKGTGRRVSVGAAVTLFRTWCGCYPLPDMVWLLLSSGHGAAVILFRTWCGCYPLPDMVQLLSSSGHGVGIMRTTWVPSLGQSTVNIWCSRGSGRELGFHVENPMLGLGTWSPPRYVPSWEFCRATFTMPFCTSVIYFPATVLGTGSWKGVQMPKTQCLLLRDRWHGTLSRRELSVSPQSHFGKYHLACLPYLIPPRSPFTNIPPVHLVYSRRALTLTQAQFRSKFLTQIFQLVIGLRNPE